MALTAFTSRLGRGQGRLLTSKATGGDYAFVLGEDEPARYLVVFHNPGELYPGGGASLNAAVIEFDRGKLEVVDKGAVSSHFFPGNPSVPWNPTADGPYYAETGATDGFAWSNLHQDFRVAGEDMMRSWVANGGQPVDGVISLDPAALQAAVAATGPIQSELYGEITADNLISKLFYENYNEDPAAQQERHKINQQLIDEMLARMQDSNTALTIGRAIFSTAPGQHIRIRLSDGRMEKALREAEADGAQPDPEPDRIAFYTQNQNASKVDIFQTRMLIHDVQLDADGQLITEIVVATTRPETMLGDTAIAVHPDDERYKALIGRHVIHPILGRRIPIVGDSILVDPSFGTGAVKVTPAHDFNDFEVGKRHNLPFINLMNPDATLNQNGGPFAGLDRFEARKQVKIRIESIGLDRGSQPHTMALPCSQRSGAVVEPMVSTQWFVKMAPLAAPAVASVEHGFTRFVPESWENTYYSWMRNIKDWCISRQLWWGHQIPAWHCASCAHVTVSREDPSACGACGSLEIKQDEDVLDTWFSSALWPFSTLGWPEQTADLAKWYPTAVLVTAFDIIFFWVARMMFSGLHNMGSVPFKDVYIHALVRDEEGQKMSKTKGNVVDPLSAIDRHGADAFRMTLAALAAQGRDVLWSEKRIDTNVKFQNKVWQAFRFLAMHVDAYDPSAVRTLSPYDHWILARAGEAVRRVRGALDTYRFNEAAAEIYQFTWSELCDWYIELCKPTLYAEGDDPGKQGALHTLITVWSALIRLFHPIMPFLSEELWQLLPGTSGSVCVAPYPKPEEFPSDQGALREVAALQDAIVAVRQIRADMEISMRQTLTIRMAEPSLLAPHVGALSRLVSVSSVEQGARTGVCATALAGGVELFLPLEGIIDVEAERSRLIKGIEKSKTDEETLERRLAAPGFADRAPPAVVAEFQEKHAAARDRRVKLEAALAMLGG